MIEKRIRKNIEYNFDTETKLFYNPTTQKWVKNPEQKKGENKGQFTTSRYKLKKVLKNLKTPPKYFIPSLLTEEDIQDIAKRNKIDVDKIKLILTEILFKHTKKLNYYRKKKHLLEKFKETHLVPINKKTWRNLLGGDVYLKYLRILLREKIIETDNFYWFDRNTNKGKCKYWRINQLHIGFDPTYRKEEITHPKVLLKRCDDKEKIKMKWLRKALGTGREPLIESTYRCLESIDTVKWCEYYNNHLYEFYDINNPTEKGRKGQLKKIDDKKTKHTPDEFFDMIEMIQNGNTYFNSKDVFGNRFHSMFTNTSKVLRKAVMFENNKYGIEYDIVNSQMAFLVLIINEFEVCKPLISEQYHNKFDSFADLKHHPDIKTFTEKVLNGEIYEYVAEKLKLGKGKYGRNKAKKMVFKIFFSNTKQNRRAKDKLENIFPSLIERCGILNDMGQKLVPKFCQRLESNIMIDGIALQYLKESKSDIITVHDSCLINSDNSEIFKKIFNIVLEKHNIDKIYLKSKFNNYEDENSKKEI